ncbi:hypothetical protein BC828DRAFT_406796 [Blastocladiella britannica]|nr:hypothetical protein BC828DRAFT_406796 [Blastocladiella britannica]
MSQPAAFPRGKVAKTSTTTAAPIASSESHHHGPQVTRKPRARKAADLSDNDDDNDTTTIGSASLSKSSSSSLAPAAKKSKLASGKPVARSTMKPKGGRRDAADTTGDDDNDDASSKPARAPLAFNLTKVFADKQAIVGLIKEIKELDIVVQLPGGQFGFVSITEISPTISALVAAYAAPDASSGDGESDDDEDEEKELPNLNDFFTVGQMVLVKVTAVQMRNDLTTKRVELTMQPAQVMSPMSLGDIKPGTLVQGAVASQEDHGVMVDLGLPDAAVSGVRSFVPQDAIPASESSRLARDGAIALFKVHAYDRRAQSRVVTLHPVVADAPIATVTADLAARFPVHVVHMPFALPVDTRPLPPIAVGDVVRGEILEHTANGMMVKLLIAPTAEEAKQQQQQAKKDAAAAANGRPSKKIQKTYEFRGLVPTLHISDISLSHPEKRFPVESKHKFRVLTVDGLRFSLTAKKTLVNSDLPVVVAYSRDLVGTIAHGVIINVLSAGCVVSLYNHVRCFVPKSDMSHEHLESTADFKRGQPVKCRIFYVGEDDKKMSASFLLEERTNKKSADGAAAAASGESKKEQRAKQREAAKAAKAAAGPKSLQLAQSLDFGALPYKSGTPPTSITDLRVDMDVHGYVINVRDKAGVFVALAPTLTGRVKIAELSNEFVRDWLNLYKVGDPIACRVTALAEDGKIELSCKARKRVAAAVAEVSSDEEDEDEDEGDQVDVVNAAISDSDGNDDSDDSDDEEEDVEGPLGIAGEVSDDEGESSTVLGVSAALASSSAGLRVSKGFSWSNSLSDDEEDENADDEDQEVDDNNSNYNKDAMEVDGSELSKTQQRRQKLKAKEDAERAVEQRQAALLAEPQLATDYERLLVGSPNSSFLWIKYMAFQLKLADVTKARAVAERAIQVIHYREEQEKLNVWVAWLNLENQFGDRSSLETLFKRAVQYNDPRTVYQHLVDIYARSGKHDLAEEVYNEMVLKFKDAPQAWLRFAGYLFERTRGDEARALLPRALKSVAKAKHIELISQFAMLEFKHGDAERGRTIFEGVLANYPKRVDLWSVYLDMEVKARNMDASRKLFERIITLKFSAKKVKFFFKKWLEFEKKFGDEDRIAYVKQRAVEYVESINRGE